MIDDWKARVAAGHTDQVVRELLARHYDPGYASSTQRNFARFGQALAVPLADRSPASLRAACALILASQAPATPPDGVQPGSGAGAGTGAGTQASAGRGGGSRHCTAPR